MINAFIKGQSLKVVAPVIVSDSIKYLEAKFHFQTSDWDGLSKWAHFSKGETVYDIRLNEDDAITKSDNLNLSAGEWGVYVHGTSGDGTRITTEKAFIEVKKSGILDGEPFPNLPLSAFEQLENRVDNIESSITTNENGTLLKLKTNAVNLNFAVAGRGDLIVDYGDGTKEWVRLNGAQCLRHRYSKEIEERTVLLSGAAQIKELDVHECDISEIQFFNANDLEKLIAYNNDIRTLDVSKLENLQYLHIFGNEICEDRNNLFDLFRKLPNRNNKSFGSIIMYPFYPLGVLVYKSGSSLSKYPNNKPVTPVDGEYYRDMNAASVVWYKYENGAFNECKEQNHLINLRIDAEKITLPKKWLFGSAIQYTAEYEKCPHYFRNNHVADYWETAEKGLGQVLGICDFTAGQVLGFEKMNVVAFSKADGSEAQPREEEAYDAKDIHGDVILSATSSRGEMLYGIAPDSNLYLVDIYADNRLDLENYAKAIRRITENSTVISNSYLPNRGYVAAKPYFEGFSWKHPLLSASGNFGDGKPWTEEPYYDIENRYGNGVFMVTNIDYDNRVSGISPTKVCPSFTYRDYYAEYGSNIKVYSALRDRVYRENGTSIGTPICASIIMLMLNVYAKMHEAENSFGKDSQFMKEFVRNHTDPLYFNINAAVGNGRPDLMVYNQIVESGVDLSVQVSSVRIDNVEAKQGVGTKIPSAVSPANADNILLTYDYDMTKLALMGNEVFPLYEDDFTENVIARSNMTEGVNASFDVFATEENKNTYEIEEHEVLVIDDDEYLSVSGAEYGEGHTVQIVVDLPDIDPNTSEENSYYDLLSYVNGSEKTHLRVFNKADSERKNDILMLVSSQDEDYNVGLAKCILSAGNQWEDIEGSRVVLTLVYCQKRFEVYANGNLLGRGEIDCELFLDGLIVFKEFLATNDKKSIRVYDRVLSNFEIIKNTIALLNGNGKDPNGLESQKKTISAIDTILAYGDVDAILDELLDGGHNDQENVNSILEDII